MVCRRNVLSSKRPHPNAGRPTVVIASRLTYTQARHTGAVWHALSRDCPASPNRTRLPDCQRRSWMDSVKVAMANRGSALEWNWKVLLRIWTKDSVARPNRHAFDLPVMPCNWGLQPQSVHCWLCRRAIPGPSVATILSHDLLQCYNGWKALGSAWSCVDLDASHAKHQRTSCSIVAYSIIPDRMPLSNIHIRTTQHFHFHWTFAVGAASRSKSAVSSPGRIR